MTATGIAAETGEKQELHHTIYIGKPAAAVWEALTEKKIIDTYYLVPVSTLELKAGGKIAYGKGTSELITGTITEIEAPAKLVHTFRFTGSEDPETTVTYEVHPFGDGMCVLEITHSGFPEKNETYSKISSGWPMIASSLKTVLETGNPLPWPKE